MLHPADGVHAAVVFMTELGPERAAGVHAMVPGGVVPPEQPLVGAVVQVLPLEPGAGGILPEGVTACGGAVEPDAGGVGLMVVYGVPVRAGSIGEPGTRSIMMFVCHDVMQA